MSEGSDGAMVSHDDLFNLYTPTEMSECKKVFTMLKEVDHCAIKIKLSLIERGKIPNDFKHEKAKSDKGFLQLMADMVLISCCSDNPTDAEYGYLVDDNGFRHNIASDFQLANKNIKPKFYKEIIIEKNLSAKLCEEFVSKRRKLQDKLDTVRDLLIKAMRFEREEKVTPIKEVTKADVKKRINDYMVCIKL